MQDRQIQPRVAIVGGGIAGLTAALRLSSRGYDTTLYESEEVLGGNLSARYVDGTYHDVYPHMFPDWYANFWDLVENDLGLAREKVFERRWSVKGLSKGLDNETGEYKDLTNASTFRGAYDNLKSGFQPLPDMFCYAYSLLDLACQELDPTKHLNRFSVNGFLHSTPYATERAAQLHDALLLGIWSVNSDDTSASAYSQFLELGMRINDETPFLWLLKGNAAAHLIDPLERALLSAGCEVRKNHRVKRVSLREGVDLWVESPEQPEGESVSFDYVILAVPPHVLGQLAEAADPGYRLIDRVEGLSEVRRLRAEPIPVVDLYFNKKIEGIPKQNVALLGSRSALSFLDLSQLWPEIGREVTVLSLASSDYYRLPPLLDEEYGHKMIRDLQRYLPGFNPGNSWKSDDTDIDWSRTQFQDNTAHRLFINEVGSEKWRPGAYYDNIPNVAFAGDCCQTTVDMATVEAAILSGVHAARAIWRQHPLGQPIQPIQHPAHSQASLLAMKLALSPFAYGSKLWSTAIDFKRATTKGPRPRDLVNLGSSLISAPFHFAGDWWSTAAKFWGHVLSPERGPRPGRRPPR